MEFLSRSSDVVRYHDTVTRHKAGAVPYRDLEIEYPPVSWWLMWAPGQFDLQAEFDANFPVLRVYPRFQDQMHGIEPGKDIFPLTGQKQPMDRLTRIRAADLIVYYHRFRTFMFVLEAGMLGLLILWLVRMAPHRAFEVAFGVVLANAVLAPVLYDRLDVGLGLVLMGFAAAYVRIQPDRPGLRMVAYLVLGFGIAVKVIPVLIVPFVLLVEGRLGKQHIISAAAFVAGALGPFAVHVSAGSGLWYWVGYHAERGLEAESTAAGLVMGIGRLIGAPPAVESSYGSLNLTCAACGPAATVSSLVLGTLVLAVLGWAYRSRDSLRREDGLTLGFLVVGASVVFSKVFSPQYLVWSGPLILGSAAMVLDRKRWWGVLAAFLAISALTTWLFPYHFVSHIPYTGPMSVARLVDPLGLLPAMPFVTVGVLMLRNFAFAAVIGFVGWSWYRARKPT